MCICSFGPWEYNHGITHLCARKLRSSLNLQRLGHLMVTLSRPSLTNAQCSIMLCSCILWAHICKLWSFIEFIKNYELLCESIGIVVWRNLEHFKMCHLLSAYKSHITWHYLLNDTIILISSPQWSLLAKFKFLHRSNTIKIFL